MDDKTISFIFFTFSACYGRLWTSLFQSPEELTIAKRVWTNKLSGFKPDQVKIALDKCTSTQDYPPTLPMFIRYCANLKTIPPYMAYKQYIGGNCSGLAKKAGDMVGQWEMNQGQERETWPKFKAIYETLVNDQYEQILRASKALSNEKQKALQ